MAEATMIKQNEKCSHLQSLQKKKDALTDLMNQLKLCKSPQEKLKVLPEISFPLIEFQDIDSQVILRSLFAISQGKRIFKGSPQKDKILKLIETLLPVEEFYKDMCGIVGYHYKFLELLLEKEQGAIPSNKKYQAPPGIDLRKNTIEVNTAIKNGIDSLGEIAEIYPIAGAADRLDLRHHHTKEALPAAQLNFLGYTLLEGLIRDVIGREYLHFKLHGKKITVPFILMTSKEKNNSHHVNEIFESKHWFNRPKNSFFFIEQAQVPVIRYDGDWAVKEHLTLAVKPGGHGTLWKSILDQNAFTWLKNQGKTKAIIRQINNPVAGVDQGLLALSGIGCGEHRVFGFASCDRYVGAEEGMDVLIEEKTLTGFVYSISNLEYTDFEKQGIFDKPEEPGSTYSCFPANSNILFADLVALEKTILKHPFPGLTINIKSKTPCVREGKEVEHVLAGRLESTMQNIADYLITEAKEPLSLEQKNHLPTFVTYNKRRKTIAATKRSFTKGGLLRDTPEGTFLDAMLNSKELLEKCQFTVPALKEDESYLSTGPSFLFTYHPALGPLYSIIAQKLKKGHIEEFSELKLEIAEIMIENLKLKGSLQIFASDINLGKCILKNVSIENEGIDSDRSSFWNYHIHHNEKVNIKIEGNGEFVAENVTFKKNYNITVPSGHRIVAKQDGENIKFIKESIREPSWEWKYHYNEKNEIILNLFDNYNANS